MSNFDVSEWIRYAQMDYDAAVSMATQNPELVQIICYHCQQCAEKILKAFIIANNEPLVKTHDLETLIDQCLKYDKQFDEVDAICSRLTDYATVTRYPPMDSIIDEDEMRAALKDAEDILKFTKEKLLKLG
jgi:HEPN domain-containing protein